MAESENNFLNSNLPVRGSVDNTYFNYSNINSNGSQDQDVNSCERVRNQQRSYSSSFISPTDFNVIERIHSVDNDRCQSSQTLNYAVTSSNFHASPSYNAIYNNGFRTPSTYHGYSTPSNAFLTSSNIYQAPNEVPVMSSNVYGTSSNTYRTSSNICGTPNTVHVTPNNIYRTPNNLYGIRTTNHVTSCNNASSLIATFSNRQQFDNTNRQHNILQHQSSVPNFQVTSPTNFNNTLHSISVDEYFGFPRSRIDRPLSNSFRPDNSAQLPLHHSTSWSLELNPNSCSISDYLYKQNESMFRLYDATSLAVKDEERLKEEIRILESQVNSLPRVQNNSNKLDYLDLQEENNRLQGELLRMYEDLDKLGVPIPKCNPSVPVEIDENWECPQCTFKNLALPKCEMCECLRPGRLLLN
ncbi:uncharacterized protein LOC105850422 [Hydra vulgaris]|uniref:uncharacterized protein LOC105850422 n=1 Tax=Hydra vulgaris TaxID=6087 RepID=UPI000640FF53|nr:uncharacterized protein LOC105850422 [Hydra vulgaris]XP_047140702.1 uncharacterized protein LOC105850422 [Hydra vulgaris]XP_047140703.1 uncharacterized protein LOC105850422 [Hydra vulgaris]XP_047140704.1 uncharacterized protein LOC105850422 [Hydra vulgaris]XP_047140705.1 uncharacterized protein LOC105850422 [Hydra vulgaris]XP_047140706.1 uncharacterized protein LOC105850422 [Hydra vulgaris]XP_047140707.1 uncharacterized protein LOC105850422 [Hydra vulgaris]XP_047140708.1 uncharacterized p